MTGDMPTALGDIWVYLSTQPLLWLAATLAAYALGDWLYRRSGERAAVNAVAIAIALLIGLLALTGTSYEQYFEGAQFVHFMLGPAVVALAVPLHRNRQAIRQALMPIVAALGAGATTAIVSALAIAHALGGSSEIMASLAPKSATAPIAMGIAEQTGGLPSLTAGLVILTGILGAVFATPLLGTVGIRDARATGFALGLTSHGIGTARALQIDETAGAFAAIALALTGLAMALLAPPLTILFR
ncbi:MAG: LrgB family protein [Alphaproteobacteria bacterium]|nr:LrgB family protein [Alphaproteobacteria bacterium]MCY4230179.1 LrgB family protein [Alphaproteobacteria bacterium]